MAGKAGGAATSCEAAREVPSTSLAEAGACTGVGCWAAAVAVASKQRSAVTAPLDLSLVLGGVGAAVVGSTARAPGAEGPAFVWTSQGGAEAAGDEVSFAAGGAPAQDMPPDEALPCLGAGGSRGPALPPLLCRCRGG